ncbi:MULTISPECIES: hypothetical protein [Chryseobacterium]|uniref:hypothetical protein n=1 Tax=Chryseobacterium TaxID=59732 RepID=UPI001BEA7D05|nr:MULTISPECIES: hypothetical protein [Chryseobacterium]MBT2622128.1 hypothetical protein [Chryseobacterium sp. ISL-6]
MKTKIFSIGFISLLSVWMLFQSCNGDSENDLSKGTVVSQDYKNQLINSKTAQTLGDNYLANNYTLLLGRRTAKGLSGEDARQVVYPIEVLEAYVDHVKLKVGDDALIGVNIGQYPANNVIDNHQRQGYKGYQTMYLMSYKTANDTISPSNCVEAMNHGNLIPPDATTNKNDIVDKNFENYLIADDAAALLYDTYTFNNEKTLDAQGVEVKRQYFYSVNVLKGYLQYVKEEAVAKGITEVNISINIGQNSFSSDMTSKGKQKGGSQCIYFTAFPKGSDMKDMVSNPLNSLSALK